MSTFGERLRAARLSHGFTQVGLASEVGCSGGAIGLWEQDRREPSLATIEHIADVLNIPFDALVSPEIDENDDELEIFRQELRRRPEIRSLFRVTRRCSTAEVLQAIRILEALHEPHEGE